MSYCVHCGVELHETSKSCPLCNTPIVNPRIPLIPDGKKPFAEKKGQVDRVRHSDMAILLSVVLGSTGLSCGILNFFIFHDSFWSFYIIGACILLWVFCIPFLIYTKLPWFLSIIFDGMALVLYCGIISFSHPGNGWFIGLAIPIIVLITGLFLIFVFLLITFRTSILSTSIYLFLEIGFLCTGIEILIHKYFEEKIYVTWSAIVFICCSIIVISLFTIIRRSRLREAVRRRMHI